MREHTVFARQDRQFMRSFVSQSVQKMKPSGIRRYFDIAATMENVITLGIG